MISFALENCRFNYRVAGLAVRPSDGAVLLHRAEHEPFWSLPGGRCEMNEAAADAVSREMREEIGVQSARVERLLWVVENFFAYQSDHDKFQHELGLYFLVSFPGDAWIYEQTGPFMGSEAFSETTPIPLYFDWKLPNRLPNALPIVPEFLGPVLFDLPDVPTHIVNREALPF